MYFLKFLLLKILKLFPNITSNFLIIHKWLPLLFHHAIIIIILNT